ncbi:lipoprotein-releasing ABC transporter permease subunit [Teredinibacter turnerae]|uniref:lipoprotein-releasing ABC transporter permease subunit n=1 Tax=Teredinibacter turnerae TaxID=2426 RepID=UPI00041E7CC6|nr:lipoprotein-releasing ABC transporter permease subunit [Teredinibacter turnerae]
MRFSFFVGFRYAGAKRRSQLVSFLSGMSVAGLMVGVGLLVAVLSIMNGFDREMRDRILGLVPQAAVFERDGIEDWRAVMETLKKDSRIAGVAPFVQVDGLASYRNNTAPVLLYGIDPASETNVSRILEYVDEQSLAALDASSENLLLGASLAGKLGVAQGSRLMVVIPDNHGSTSAPHIAYFKVSALIKSNTELDNTLALASLASVAHLTGNPSTVTGVRLRLNSIFSAPQTVYENLVKLGPGFYGTNWTRTHGNLYQAIQMSKNLVGLLMSLIVAIAAFNIISTLIMVVVDKQGDIAILRTLGATTKTIMMIFVVQGTSIGLVGTFLGVIFGCGLAFVAQDILQLLEAIFHVQFLKSDVYPLTYLPTEIRLSDIARVAFTALGLSFLATIYPAYRASKVQPAESLRYE